MSEQFDFSPKNIIRHLASDGVRVYEKTLVSPYSGKDSAKKCQLVNYMVERYGYRLADGRGFTPYCPRWRPLRGVVAQVLATA